MMISVYFYKYAGFLISIYYCKFFGKYASENVLQIGQYSIPTSKTRQFASLPHGVYRLHFTTAYVQALLVAVRSLIVRYT